MNKSIYGILTVLVLSSSAHALDGRAQAHCYNTKGVIRHNAQINSTHTASFINDTYMPQLIHITYKVCAEYYPCTDKYFDVVVQPHTTWSDNLRLGLMVNYTRPGKYVTRAETIIDGAVQRREISKAKIEVEDD